MSKRAVLRFYGSLEQGFHVSLEVGEENDLHFADQEGTLPSALGLIECLQQWQESYTQLSNETRIKGIKIAVQLGAANQAEICRQRAKALREQLKAWLASESFQVINAQLQWAVTQNDLVRVVLCTQDRRLHLLPWHEWTFIERYQAEVAFNLPARKSEKQNKLINLRKKVRILAILGDSDGINTEADLNLLKALPDTDVLYLVQPLRQEIHDHLWEQSWDILFFAGHSQTEDCEGRIFINANDSLTIADLRFALKRAIAHGLQLAIFNSCDGLGLVYELEQLGIPQLVVMRQPVPDRVAQAFLKHLLTSLIDGQRFYLAVREAREKLQSLEDSYPSASWLPVIFQSLNQPPLTWQDLRYPPVSQPLKASVLPLPYVPTSPSRRVKQRLFWKVMITSLILSSLVLGARWLGWLQPVELMTFDQLMRSRPAELPDERIVLITVDDADLEYQTQRGMTLQGSLSDAALNQLLTKLQPHQPLAIGLDIHRDRPVDAAHPTLKTQLQTVFAICTQADRGKNIAAISPPPEVPQTQIGFSNIPLDPDRVIRRHIIGQAPAPVCSTDKSLSYLLALEYLQIFSIPTSFENQKLQLGSKPIPRVVLHTGGYHDLDWGGYTTLLNYRQADPFMQQIPLAKVLNGSIDHQLPGLIRNRVILIGTIAPRFGDYHNTPIGKRAGVVIHAHMVSQLLSTVLDQRPLLWSLSWWGDALWIWGWAISGGVITTLASSKLKKGVAGVCLIGCLYVSCSLMLWSGGWLPLVPSGLAGLGTAGVLCLLPQRKFDS
uniref:CHASE2 domain-containing protein n=1 Tax=Oscillatoriales cyanobacterium SpSt-402 TaxID=2282168 RepID=A0A832H108_9CYAN